MTQFDSVQIDSGNEEMNTVISELIASELLAEPFGGIALKTVHRFLAYNSEWVGQVEGGRRMAERMAR